MRIMHRIWNKFVPSGFPATDSETPVAPQPNAQSVSPIVFALLRRGPGHDRDLYYPLQRDDQGSGFVAYKFFQNWLRVPWSLCRCLF